MRLKLSLKLGEDLENPSDTICLLTENIKIHKSVLIDALASKTIDVNGQDTFSNCESPAKP